MKILLVEDNEADIDLLKEVFGAKGYIVEFIVAHDAQQADCVLGRILKGELIPRIIMLDINIPKGGGFKVLTNIRANEFTKLTPVIVFSSSSRVEDIKMAYNLKANCYITKPFEFEDMLNVADLINKFWLETAKLPQ